MLFRRRSSPEDSIAKLTGRLGLQEGDRTKWDTTALGQCALKRGVSEGSGSYYELNVVQALNPSTLTFPGSRFVYLPDGTVIGVLRAEINTINRNDDLNESAIDFQIENGLVVPNSVDKEELVELLKAGVA